MIAATGAPEVARRRIVVEGIVQGVGFRPFIFNLARRYDLAGWVLNNAAGVVIEAEGRPEALDGFEGAIAREAPPLARIAYLVAEPLAPAGERDFCIAPSHGAEEKRAWISPDACICPDCLAELFDPANRRYRYPFINCTNCGPRFTIIQDVPYDRLFTTMAGFEMCPDCRREYDDPQDRRFHAQPNACPACGPRVRLADEDGAEVETDDVLEAAARRLAAGEILAVKGLGGYHLACDALDEAAVARLRGRKHRWGKPFALMVPDLAAARALCPVRPEEEALLVSRRRPIVLLAARRQAVVAAGVAPGQYTLGLMLPYTPLHYLLLEAFGRECRGRVPALVMTSGNRSDEPIAYRDGEARERLAGLADAFLVHDRPIHMRCDDSVVQVMSGRAGLVRRSRGYAPEPIRAPVEFRQPVLAVGGHLKNTFCLGKGRYAFVSHHIGDLENYETLQSFSAGIDHFRRLFDVEPEVLACDLHPDYLATQYAHETAAGRPVIGVQHHHAHIAAVTGEHGVAGTVIGVAFDGTGYGLDGTIWGGEFLVADWTGFERVAHLEPVPLLGGEQAIRQVWRLAAAWLYKLYGDDFLALDLPFVKSLDRGKWRTLRQMADRGLNAPRSSAMGRLFDAVAALAGVRQEAHYEGQAAIELESLAAEGETGEYPFQLAGVRPRVLRVDGTLRAIVADLRRGVAPEIVSARFHNTVARATVAICAEIRRETGLERVALGGGVFQNARLLSSILAGLAEQGFETFVAEQLPPNDGGLAFGQAVVAAERIT